MTILLPLSQVADLFPPTIGDTSESVEERIRAYYRDSGFEPSVKIRDDVVVIELDHEATQGLDKDIERAASLAERGDYSGARKRLEGLLDKAPQDSELHRMYAQTFLEEGDAGRARD